MGPRERESQREAGSAVWMLCWQEEDPGFYPGPLLPVRQKLFQYYLSIYPMTARCNGPVSIQGLGYGLVVRTLW